MRYSLSELIQQREPLAGSLSGAQLPRLSAAGVHMESSSYRVSVHRRPQDRLWIEGALHGTWHLGCQWCEETVERSFELRLAYRLARCEAEADEIAPEEPVVVLDEGILDMVSFLEDELLLSIPGAVCVDPQCERRPKQEYGSGEQPDVETSVDPRWAELKQWKSGKGEPE